MEINTSDINTNRVNYTEEIQIEGTSTNDSNFYNLSLPFDD